jgi:hypothetical protein
LIFVIRLVVASILATPEKLGEYTVAKNECPS